MVPRVVAGTPGLVAMSKFTAPVTGGLSRVILSATCGFSLDASLLQLFAVRVARSLLLQNRQRSPILLRAVYRSVRKSDRDIYAVHVQMSDGPAVSQ